MMIDFDIYKISCNLSEPLLKEAQSWKKSHSDAPLASVLMEHLLIPTKEGKSSGVEINLTFVKSVSTTQILEAFYESFKDCDPITYTKFLDILQSAIGSDGMKPGKVIEFHWLHGGGLLVAIDGEYKGYFDDNTIEKRLLEIYIDPHRTVSPEFVNDLLHHLEHNPHGHFIGIYHPH